MLRLSTFGSVDLQDPEGRDLRPVLAQSKRLTLLIYLAAAQSFAVHRRSELLALFWPDLDDTRARDALDQALRFLRQALGQDTFVRRGAEDVGIDPERFWCDAVAFQAALEAGRPAEALELYRGDFLQGLFIEEGGGFEEWMGRERTALRESAARGARQLAEEHASGEALKLAIDWGRKALELAPGDERALRQLLRWHDRAGDRAGAFRAYEAFVRRFEEEFGGEPSSETRALAEQLKAGRPLEEERGAAVRGVLQSPLPFAKDSGVEIGDRYRIVRKLGAGGMAIVYLAEDVKHDREVAIKVLRPEIAEGLARARFIREIRIAGRLQHPNIVPLFDSGVADGRLYYVMAHIEGETLRDRLAREGRFEISLVQHILREVAGALAYAHERGVIHRDIKPENILLIDQRAVLTDFGIARAAHAARTGAAPDQTLTQTGTSLGTPNYMAPEQAAGNPDIDQRADLYALGVVAYEMLVGRLPFVGSTPKQLLAAQLTKQPVPVSDLRPDTPAGLDMLVMRCLEEEPAGRPDSAQAFLAELEGGRPVSPAAPWWRRRVVRQGAAVAGGLLVAALLGLLISRGVSGPGGPETPGAAPVSGADAALPDTSRYAILPFTRDPSVPVNLPIEQFMQDAFARWGGISVVDRFQVNDAMTRRDTARFSNEEAGRVAAEVGAGRYIRGEVTPIGDSLRVYAGLYDVTRSNRLLADRTVRVMASLAAADSAFASLADGLLFPGGSPGSPAEARVGTRSLPARKAYGRGYAAIQEWELARADSEFVRATELDAEYTEAFLWLAQVRSWRGLPAAQWSFAADRAAAGRMRLTRRDRTLSDALTALAAGEIPKACATLIELTKQEPHDFAAWYGMGTCLSRDSIVVQDRRSPSGWAFRSSYSAALEGYSRAFQLLPSIHKALGARAFEPVRTLLRTSALYPRSGAAVGPGGTKFLALPSWEGDSLAFVPRPAMEFLRPNASLVPRSVAIAVQQQRELFHRVASGWAATDPKSPDALEALAVSLSMLADPSCLDALKRAQALTHAPEERIRRTGVEVWMRLKLALPSDLAGIRTVRRLADSLLRAYPNGAGRSTSLLVGLAVLTGRAGVAASLARETDPDTYWGVPPQISRSAAPLLVFAALGGPRDSLEALVGEVRLSIERVLRPPAAEQAYFQWLVRSATLAFPPHAPKWFVELPARGDYLLEAQQASLRGDTTAARRALEEIRTARQSLPPEDLALDTVHPEAAIFASFGDARAALAWLDPALNSLARTAPQVSGEPGAVGAIMRASVLRAELAIQTGDSASAKRWAQVVSILWSDADSFLQPVVDRMRRLARIPG